MISLESAKIVFSCNTLVLLLLFCIFPLVDGKQFDVEDEGGAAGDAGLRTDGAARDKPNLFRLFRVVTEDGEAKLAVAHLGGDIDLPSAVLLFALPEQPVAYGGYLIAIVERCHVFHALA